MDLQHVYALICEAQEAIATDEVQCKSLKTEAQRMSLDIVRFESDIATEQQRLDGLRCSVAHRNARVKHLESLLQEACDVKAHLIDTLSRLQLEEEHAAAIVSSRWSTLTHELALRRECHDRRRCAAKVHNDTMHEVVSRESELISSCQAYHYHQQQSTAAPRHENEGGVPHKRTLFVFR